MEAFNEGYVTSLIKEIEGIGCRCGTFSGCGIHSLCNSLRFTLFPKIELPMKNYCNLHNNCNEANTKARAEGNLGANHDYCEECFGY